MAVARNMSSTPRPARSPPSGMSNDIAREPSGRSGCCGSSPTRPASRLRNWSRRSGRGRSETPPVGIDCRYPHLAGGLAGLAPVPGTVAGRACACRGVASGGRPLAGDRISGRWLLSVPGGAGRENRQMVPEGWCPHAGLRDQPDSASAPPSELLGPHRRGPDSLLASR
jgi:hypothetical protein